MTKAAQKGSWCADFFDDLFAEHCLMTRSAAEIADTVSFFMRGLRLKEGDMVFDQCCGVGTLSVALAGKGFRTQGVDLIPSYVARARRAAGNAVCRFAVGDAGAHVAPEPCDAAINWWTSFGYTPDDAENAKMLDCVFRSLKPGGWFTLDYMNAAERRRLLSGTGISGYTETKGDCTIRWDSRLEGDMLVKDWTYTGADDVPVVKRGGGAKLYTPEQLRALFEAAGFRNVEFFGSVRGETFVADSPRCIVLAQKPES